MEIRKMAIETYPEAQMAAEDEIDVDRVVREAVEAADSMNNAQTLARSAVEDEIDEEFPDVPDHLREDVKDELGWLALREAGSTYIEANIEEFQ